jgi:SAM-dependent methyltransferase
MEPVTNSGLPRWVNEQADWYAERRPAWLKGVHATRQAIFQRLARGESESGPADAAAVDALVGLMLIRRFVQHRTGLATLHFALPSSSGRTVDDIRAVFRGRVSSPLLWCVFDSAALPEHSEPLFTAAVVSDGSARLPDTRFPVTAFGDCHQLCLARPLHGLSGTASGNERRSRGVHFTPAPLVDYLTDATLRGCVGPGTDFRVLDPSCGCGVFLIAATRLLAAQRPDVGDPCRVQRLLDVMGANTFGIDINPRAVDWTRRSLLLAAWEGDPMGDHSRLRIPDLDRNLIVADFLGTTAPAEFPASFDAILGGPPFVRYSQLKKDIPQRIEEWRTRFVTARVGQFDLYMPFFEQAVRHLRPGGRIGWSVSNTFLRSAFGGPLRRFLAETCMVQELVEFENPKVYADAATQIVLVQLKKGAADTACRFVLVKGKPDLRTALDAVAGVRPRTDIDLQIRQLPAATFRGEAWRLIDDGNRSPAPPTAVRTLKELGIRITQGVVTGADPVFLLRVIDAGRAGLTRVEDREGRQHLIESALLRPAVRSRVVHGYSTPLTKNHLLLPYNARGHVLSEPDLVAKFPAAYKYLVGRRSEIPVTGRSQRPFYAFRNDAVLRLPPGPRILIGMVTSGADATLDIDNAAVPHAGVLILHNIPAELDPHFLLAVLNSPVFWSFVRSTMPTMGVGRRVLRRGPLAGFRVPLASAVAQSEIAAMVRHLMSVSTPCDRTRLKNSIDAAILGCVNSAPESMEPAAVVPLADPGGFVIRSDVLART